MSSGRQIFIDREDAGRQLAKRLLEAGPPPKSSVVLALVRGGVPIGFELAKQLGLPLDIVVVRKLGVPEEPELAMGAIAGSIKLLDSALIRELGIPAESIERVIEKERAEMRRREALYRGAKPEIARKGRPVILVDDGLATGSSMRVAVDYVRSEGAGPISIAVPVGSRSACKALQKHVDHLVCLAIPDSFLAVGNFYADFREVRDPEVQALLRESAAIAADVPRA